jgi:branched-chain amino acid transport system ATP-binding protein
LADNTSLLSLHQVGAAYGRVQVLSDVSATLREGESMAVLGINGAGKTTLMRAISGLMVRRSGAIRFSDADIVDLAPHEIVHLGVAMVPEGRRLFAPMTVEENLAIGTLPLRRRGRDAEAQTAQEEVFALFPPLAERRRQIAGTLSGGEQQMLAIGRALMGRPRLLLLDEPSVGLAPKVIEQLLGALRRLKRAGLAIMLAEQHVPLALALADTALVLHLGRVELAGTAAALRDTPEIQRIYLGGSGKRHASGT